MDIDVFFCNDIFDWFFLLDMDGIFFMGVFFVEFFLEFCKDCFIVVVLGVLGCRDGEFFFGLVFLFEFFS